RVGSPTLAAGSWFHSLQATSQALHPMHTVVSVKNPIGSDIARPSPTSFERGLCPRNPGGRFRKGGEAPLRVSIPSARTSLGLLQIADEGLALVDRDVGIGDERRELVRGIAGDPPLIAPVERHAAVMAGAAARREPPPAP